MNLIAIYVNTIMYSRLLTHLLINAIINIKFNNNITYFSFLFSFLLIMYIRSTWYNIKAILSDEGNVKTRI